MSQTRLKKAAEGYLQAYRDYHVLFSKHRLKGWDGVLKNSPKPIVEAYDKQMKAFDQLHIAVYGSPRPNYTKIAEKEMGK